MKLATVGARKMRETEESGARTGRGLIRRRLRRIFLPGLATMALSAVTLPASALAFSTLALLLPADAALAQVGAVPKPRSTDGTADWLARARGAGVEADALEGLRAEALAAGLSEAELRTLGERIVRVAAGRLPWRPVLDRTRQGVAKGASFERIDAVCAGLEARLHESAALVDRAFPETDVKRPIGGRSELIDHTMFALEKGVEPTSLSTMFGALHSGAAPSATATPTAVAAYTAPVVALTSLSAEGVAGTDGVALVTQAWQSGMRDGDLENLGLTLSQALRSGQPKSLVNETADRFRRHEAAQQILGDLKNRFGGPPHDRILGGPGGPGAPGGRDGLPPPRPGQPGGGPGPNRPGLGGGHSGNGGPGGPGGPGGNDGGRPRPPRRPGGGTGGGTGGSGS